MDAWRGITDAVFEKHGIPCFSSARTDILLKPAARLIISALDTVGGGWKTNDVITPVSYTHLAILIPSFSFFLARYNFDITVPSGRVNAAAIFFTGMSSR